MFSYIIAVEHDLSVLDYLSDFVCCLYGFVNGWLMHSHLIAALQCSWSIRCGDHALQCARRLVLRRWLAMSLVSFLAVTGINIFLAGFVPTENLRFRESGLTFKVY